MRVSVLNKEGLENFDRYFGPRYGDITETILLARERHGDKPAFLKVLAAQRKYYFARLVDYRATNPMCKDLGDLMVGAQLFDCFLGRITGLGTDKASRLITAARRAGFDVGTPGRPSRAKAAPAPKPAAARVASPPLRAQAFTPSVSVEFAAAV